MRYGHAMLKQKILQWLEPLHRNRVYTIRRGIARGLKRRGGLAFLPRWSGPTPEERLVTTLEFEDDIVFDIGGERGVFTLFFARAVGPEGQVITFEPNPESRALIQEAVELNGFTNVDIRQIALGSEPGRTELVFPAGRPGYGSIDPRMTEQLQGDQGARRVEVQVETLDRLVFDMGVPGPDFIKLDVEGAEVPVLRGMRRVLEEYRPRMLIEVHAVGTDRGKQNARTIWEMLMGRDYILTHVESGALVLEHNTDVVIGQRLYASPRER